MSVDREPIDCETYGEAAGADAVVVFSSTVTGLTLRSVYVGAGSDATTVVTHLALRRGGQESWSVNARGMDLPVTHERRSCLLDHVVVLRQQLAHQRAADVRVDVDDQALELADRVWP